MYSLAGRTALVTGGGGGIGSALAKTYAGAGAGVVVVDTNLSAAEQVVAEIRQAGHPAAAFGGDASEVEVIEEMVRFAVRTYGGLDLLHNNSMDLTVGRVHELSDEGWHRTLEVGLTGYWRATKSALPVMVEQRRGVILNTASISGLLADFGMVAYNVVKAGVLHLTRVTGIEYAAKGIRCNAVCPGPINTPTILEFDRHLPDRTGAMRAAIPMGRFGDVDEVASVSLFLASDRASFVTGTHFVVDGGLLARSQGGL